MTMKRRISKKIMNTPPFAGDWGFLVAKNYYIKTFYSNKIIVKFTNTSAKRLIDYDRLLA